MTPTSIFQLPTSNLHIGFDAKRAFNNGTGLGNYSRFVISAFVKSHPENEYFLFTPTIKPEFKNFISPSQNIKIISPDSLLGKTFPALWRTYSIAEMCNELQLDIFLGLSNELPVGIEKFLGKKIVTIHDLIFLRYPDYYNNIDRYIYTKKFGYACEKADLIIAASQQTKNDIIHFFKSEKSKIEVVYQNCDERFSIPADDKIKNEVRKKYQLSEKFILSVGTIEKRKNQLTILKAFELLKDETLKLVLVGRQTKYVKQLNDFIDKNKLNKHVLLLTKVEQNDLPVIFQLSKIFVYASEFEGFGIPILEGLRSAVPVLAANTSSLTEVGGDAVSYFKFGDALDLCEKMRELISDDEKIKKLTEKGLLHTKKFDTENFVSQLATFFLES